MSPKIILFLAVLAWASVSYADEPTVQTSAAPASTAASSEADESVVDTSMTSAETTQTPGNVTIDFRNADIQNVIRILSFKSGVNIVASKDVQGAVTLRLVDVPWEKALDTILKTHGYGYDRRENIIRVDTLENLKREDLQTEVFVLNYTDAAEAEKSIKGMLSERGSLKSDKRSNSLIVTDMPTNIQSVRGVIDRLDTATPQVLIEAKIVELTLGDADRLGIDWQAKAAITGSKRPTSLPWNATQRSAFSTILPYGRGSQEGVVTGDGSGTTTSTIEDFPKGKGGSGQENLQPTFPVADKIDFTFGTIDFSQFRAILELIQTRENAKILSEPHVVTLNNQEAKVLVGEIIAIPRFERNTNTGRMEITGYTDRDLGIRLTVTPQINNDNQIVVSIHPQITKLVSYDELTPDIKAPRFTTREASTNVRIKSGQTIAIGGLIKEDVIETKSKVPLLGDVPLLQSFFSHSSKTTEKTDLLFFMTVTILKDRAPLSHKL